MQVLNEVIPEEDEEDTKVKSEDQSLQKLTNHNSNNEVKINSSVKKNGSKKVRIIPKGLLNRWCKHPLLTSCLKCI